MYTTVSGESGAVRMRSVSFFLSAQMWGESAAAREKISLYLVTA